MLFHGEQRKPVLSHNLLLRIPGSSHYISAGNTHLLKIHGLQHHPILKTQVTKVLGFSIKISVFLFLIYLNQRFNIAQSSFRIRMGKEILGKFVRTIPGNPAHGAQHPFHGDWITVHILHPVKGKPIGLFLIQSAIMKIQRLSGSHGAGEQPLRQSRITQGKAGQSKPSGNRTDLTTLINTLSNMPTDHMTDFMSKNTNQFILGFHGLDKTGIKKDQAARGCKSIELVTFDHKKVVVKILRPCHRKYLVPKVINILADIRGIKQRKLCPYRVQERFTHGAFFSDSQGNALHRKQTLKHEEYQAEAIS